MTRLVFALAAAVVMAVRADAIDLSRENWKVPSWDPRLTQAGAVKEFVGNTWCGHVQGMCANSNALYFAYHTHIVKTDWCVHLIKRVEVERHTGDICLWEGRLYTAQCHADTGKGRGRIQVFDEELNFIKEVPLARPADGITCLDGVLYVGLGPAGTKDEPYRGNWYGKFDAETLKPLCEPFRLDHGYDCCSGVQNMTTDGKYIYANYYCPDETADTPCFIVFDRDMKVMGAHLFGWRQGMDVVPGGKDGAVRFVYCTTINWIGTKHNAAVQALVQFAELKNGRIRDISRHCIFKTPIDR